ncbi:hypothetical protein SDC9_212139 [bioreactor metagenome]|uniref:1-deoxy-D-xylulose-5-phosphate synthase n=1 Tax=bioreactor metagenome TaxID=1076179 RepID=A0A645JM09_9ZZZZ
MADSVSKTGKLLVAEDCVAMGCVGERIAARLALSGAKAQRIVLCNCGEGFLPHGTSEQLRRLMGLDAKTLCEKVLEVCRGER